MRRLAAARGRDHRRAAQVARYPFRLVLSGGSTPRATYQLLAADGWIGLRRAVLRRRAFRAAGPSRIPTIAWCAKSCWPGLVHPRKLLAIPTDGTPASAADRYDETCASNMAPAPWSRVCRCFT
jgi:hypothetical protein